MSYAYSQSVPVIHARPTERAEFVRKTYLHLAGAILAFIALDAVALATSPVPFRELTNAVRHQEPEVKDRDLRIALDWLQQDHYLRVENGAFGFQHPLIRRAWCILRYLEGQA